MATGKKKRSEYHVSFYLYYAFSFLFLLIFLVIIPAQSQEKRKISLEDFYELKEIKGLTFSPDNRWLAYVVTAKNKAKNSHYSNLWMVPVAGGKPVRLTHQEKNDDAPAWSPDGRYLAFISNRSGKRGIWLFKAEGGEPYELTKIETDIESFAWSPDSSRLAFLAKDPEWKDKGENEGKEIIVVNRLQHKRDGEGYLDDRHRHIWMVHVLSGEIKKLTDGPFDEEDISFSPDGKEIIFSSNRTANPDANRNSDIWAVEIETGKIRQITTDSKPETNPCFSPDGRSVAYLQTSGPVYGTKFLWLSSADGTRPLRLTSSLDRNILPKFFWSADGNYIYFYFEDSGNQLLARVETGTGKMEKLVSGEKVINDLAVSADGHYLAFTSSDPISPPEIYLCRSDGQDLRRLTSLHEEFAARLNLSWPENIHYRSFDGREIEGWILKPPDFDPTKKYPLIVRVHGGPNAQYDTSFNFEFQLLAAENYVVLYTNPRGSSGYGEAFGRAIWADWGNKDLKDVLAGINYVIKQGYIDPGKIGIYGWSYGGILVNYAITRTNLFRAAVSGASDSDYFSCYGTDDLHLWWEEELGLPWDNFELYRRLSPIRDVKKVRTPTLFLCGQFDYRCPLPQSEMMYLSLKRLGVETELVVYPGEGHNLRQLDHQVDRMKRVLAWFNKYLK